MRRNNVIVVGAGPVGLTTALVLARSGLDVTVFEQAPALNHASNASTFHAATLDILDSFDVAKPLVQRGRVAQHLQFRDFELGRVADFDFGMLADETGFPFRLQIPHWVMMELAYANLRELPNVRFVFGSAVESARSSEGEAAVQCGDRTYSADWVLACDGAHSAVRRSLDVAMEGNSYELISSTIMTSLPLDELLPDIAPVTYLSGGADRGLHGAALLALPDHWRVSFRSTREESEQLDRSSQYIQEKLKSIVSPSIADYPVIGAFSYAVHRRVAERWRDNRVVLLGDAAHLNSPSGGMGMNSGIHDAYAIATCLVRLVEGQVDNAEFDRCIENRRRVALELVGARSENNYRNLAGGDDSRAQQIRWLDTLRRTAADPALARTFLRESAMLDHAPRPDRAQRR